MKYLLVIFIFLLLIGTVFAEEEKAEEISFWQKIKSFFSGFFDALTGAVVAENVTKESVPEEELVEEEMVFIKKIEETREEVETEIGSEHTRTILEFTYGDTVIIEPPI